MKTITEIKLILTNEELRKLKEAYTIINNIRYLCNLPFDEVTFRCWDNNNDYVEYSYEQLVRFTQLISDITSAAEIGFNNIKKGQTDD